MGDAREKVHRVFFIRHGETVDNVAGLYAGSRDSPLTNHGVQQAARLGQSFVNGGIVFNHVFSSDLSRAFKTGEAICAAQSKTENADPAVERVTTVKRTELREQDFGFYEGKPFNARSEEAIHRDKYPDFREVETRESLIARADAFLNQDLLPLLKATPFENQLVIAVVSHGMLLSTLWRCFLRRQRPSTVSLSAEVAATMRTPSIEHLGGWSNTGYLELELRNLDLTSVDVQNPEDGKGSATDATDSGAQRSKEDGEEDFETPDIALKDEEPASDSAAMRNLATLGATQSRHFAVHVKTINCTDHLQGLKRTRGGVGSAKHDEGQRSIHSFFKRQKAE